MTRKLRPWFRIWRSMALAGVLDSTRSGNTSVELSVVRATGRGHPRLALGSRLYWTARAQTRSCKHPRCCRSSSSLGIILIRHLSDSPGRGHATQGLDPETVGELHESTSLAKVLELVTIQPTPHRRPNR